MPQHRTERTGEALTLAQRRAFMKLPLDERRRQMAEQADQMLDAYEARDEAADRQPWQGGDIVES
jgi:hypothetical protein